MKRRKLLKSSAHTSGGGGGEAASNSGEGRTVALLRSIQAGQASARTITIEDRRMIVAYLVADGYASAEIAQMLKVSDRSVERDKRAIREGNALPKDPHLIEQMTGRLMSEAELSIQRIRRISREKLAPPAVRVDAEHRCFQIVNELVQRLQGLGYLPSATHRIEAELHHLGDEVPSFESLSEQVTELARLAADGGGHVPPEVCELQAEFQRASLAVKLQRAAAGVRGEGAAAAEAGGDEGERDG